MISKDLNYTVQLYVPLSFFRNGTLVTMSETDALMNFRGLVQCAGGASISTARGLYFNKLVGQMMHLETLVIEISIEEMTAPEFMAMCEDCVNDFLIKYHQESFMLGINGKKKMFSLM